MKTALALVSLVVLSSLSIYAQEDVAPDHLFASIGLYDADPPVVSESDQDLIRPDADTDWLAESLELTVLFPAEWAYNTPDETNSYPMSTAQLMTQASANGHLAKEAPYTISELDYSTLHSVTDYDYFREEGGLKLSLSR